LAEARRDVADGQFAEAGRRLSRLSAWWPGQAEVALLLGVCERETGHTDAAVAAWSRISDSSPEAGEAGLRRGEAEMDRGRLDEAEFVFSAALRRDGPRGVDVRHDLMQLFWQEGRLDEARVLIERNWDEYRRALGPDSEPALKNLRAHLSLDLEVYAIGRAQELLDRAGAAAPGDPKVWLGRANLAARTGAYAEARRWLDRYLASRPDDPVAWATVLDLAMATEDLELAGTAVGHLAIAQLPPEHVARARAWFAAHRDDVALERTVLEEHLEREPGDTIAIERLSQLEIRAGRVARAAELRRRKTELDRARVRYADRVASDFKADARELADMAETLGRWFEARAFLTIVVKNHPGDDEARARLARLERERPDPGPGPSSPIIRAS
jgi:tetratricopeptide (TPR) repeat protein